MSFGAPARADDDALAPYRDRFRLGMEKYKAGGIAEAIRVWRGVYEEIGPKRGYRLSFNLARAYDQEGEATRAAERYQSFLDEATARAAQGEAVEAIVERETHEADDRLAALKREHGRIEVVAAATAVLAQVDDRDPRLGGFTAYVAPGKHVVTFGPGQSSAERLEVDVGLGELVVAKPKPVAPPLALPDATPFGPPTRRVTQHPFSPVVLYVGVVATAASVVAPAVAYSHAHSLYDTFNSPSSTPSAKIAAASQYNGGARTLAYGLDALPIGLAVLTGGLTTWYFADAHDKEVPVSVSFGPAPGGATFTATGSF